MKRLRLLGLALGLTGIVFLLVSLLVGGAGARSTDNAKMRWDIISVDFATGTVSAGGQASARANDGSKITLTGNGTFRSNPGSPQDVTGGGKW